jgi:hypothetical protein
MMDDATQKLVDGAGALREAARVLRGEFQPLVNRAPDWRNVERQLLEAAVALEAAQRPPVGLPTIPGVYAGQRKTRWELDAGGAWWFRGHEGGAHPTPTQQDRTPSDVLAYGMPLTLLAQRPQVSPEVAEPLPVVAHKGPHDTDESMFLTAADNLDRGYPLGGGNLTRAVVELIRREVKRARFSVPSQPVYDEGKIAEVIRRQASRGQYEMPGDTLPYEGWSRMMARALVAALRSGELTVEEGRDVRSRES